MATGLAWGGYKYERRRISNHLKENDVENFVALTGDLHAYLAGYLQVNYEDSTRDPSVNPLADPDNRVGIELMAPAVTSINLSDQVPVETTSAHIEATEAAIKATNPHVDLFDGYRWGYSVVEIMSRDCLYLAYSVDKLDGSPDAEKELVAVRRVPEGENRLEEHDNIESSIR